MRLHWPINFIRGCCFFDKERVDLILAEGVPAVGLGLAVMNRLKKAAGGHVQAV